MKTLLSIFILFLVCAAAHGQPLSTTLVSQYSNTVDTVDNTETLYLSLTSAAAGTVARKWEAGTVLFKTVEISGDGSSAVATLEISTNGTDFAPIPTLSAFTIANLTTVQTFSWRVTDLAVKAFRIKVVGAGTMSYKIYGSAFLAN